MAMSIGELLGYVGLDTSHAEAAADKLTSFFEGKGGAWGKTLAAVGATAGIALGAGIAGAINLEPSRDRVVAALDLTTEQAARAGKASGKLYADGWGESAADVDAALEAVMSSIKGMRNASERELSKTTKAALALSQALDVDVVRASQVAGNMVSNKMAKNGVAAMDLLSKALSKVPVQLRDDILDAADEYGQFFNSLGIKGPQAMALLTASAGKGMYGIDKMGDSIKEFTIRATDGSKLTSGALKSIGLDSAKVSNDLLAGGNTASKAFNQVVQGLLRIKDPAKQSQAAIALFGTPLEDLGTKDIPKFLGSLASGKKGMKDWQGASERMGKTLQDNASTNLSQFTRGIQTGFVDLIGGSVLPKVTEWASALNTSLGPALEAIGSAVSSTTSFLEQHKAVAIALAAVVGTLTAVTAAHAAVLAVSAAGGMVAWLRSTMLISAATKVWAATQWALNLAMSANPLGLAIAAIVALVAAVVIAWKKSDTFRAIVIGAWEAIKSATVTVFNAVKAAVGKAFDFLKNLFLNFTGPGLIIKHWDKIKAVTGKVWGAIKSVVSSQINMIKTGIGALASIPGKIGEWFGNAKSAATRKLGALVTFVAGIPGRILDGLGDLGSTLRDAGRKVLTGLINGIKDKIGDLKGTLQGITKKLTDWKGPPQTDKKILRKNGRLIMGGLLDGISDGIPNLRKLLRDVTKDLGKKRLAKVEDAVRKQYQKGLAIAKQRSDVAAALEKATGQLEAAIQLRDGFYDSVNDNALSYASLLGAADDGAMDSKGLVDSLQKRYDALVKFRENMQELLAKGLDDASYQELLEAGVDRAGSIAETLVQDDQSILAIRDLQGKIATAASGLASDSSTHLYQAGVTMAQNTANGLLSQQSQLEATATQVGQAMAAALAAALNTDIKLGGETVKPQGKGPGKGNGKGKSGKKDKKNDKPAGREAPLVGQVIQQPGESGETLAERLWFMGLSRG